MAQEHDSCCPSTGTRVIVASLMGLLVVLFTSIPHYRHPRGIRSTLLVVGDPKPTLEELGCQLPLALQELFQWGLEPHKARGLL